MTFGQELKEARMAKKLTQEQLAEQIGVTRQTISSWERDGSQPDIIMAQRLAAALEYDFISKVESEPKKRSLPKLVIPLISFIAGVLLTVIVMQFIVPSADPAAINGYTIERATTPASEPSTVGQFKQASPPNPGEAYIAISFSEDPCYARQDERYDSGVGWRYSVYLTEYNRVDFFPETYTMYYFSDESHSTSFEYTAEDMTTWWGDCSIPARGQKIVTGGDPMQNIVGIGFKLTGTDANGNALSFYNFMETSQEIME